MATIAPRERIASMDVMRGIAVMGILVANLPGFALPNPAYFSPMAWGGSTGANIWVWFTTYVLIEGKMRGMFTFLFGASMLLVIDGARAKGESPARVHYSRMATLAVIGALHLYLFWWGDILLHYAMVGAIAFLFARLSVRWLMVCGLGLLALQVANDAVPALQYFAAAARDTPEKIAFWNQFAPMFGVPPLADIRAQIAAIRSDFVSAAIHRWTHEDNPLMILAIFGMQTLSAMLLGMAGYKSGFLTGRWERARYRRWATVCLGITVPLYVLLAINTLSHGFFPPWVFFDSIVAAEPLRPLMVAGYAALVVLLMRPGGWLTTRLAAVGRAAFTNYLGTTLMMTFIFSGWGLGQYGAWQRWQLYLLVPLAWAIMLAWSKPWLDRFAYGPLEWVWRTMARLEVQPFRRSKDSANASQ